MSSSDAPETNEMYPGISGRTHGEMNDRNPATKAASSVTFSDTCYSTSVTGIPASVGVAGLPANLTGGRSWNMKSHFQRSEGLEACSQCFAETGRAKPSCASPA